MIIRACNLLSKNQDITTQPTRHRWQTIAINSGSMKKFVRFPEFIESHEAYA